MNLLKDLLGHRQIKVAESEQDIADKMLAITQHSVATKALTADERHSISVKLAKISDHIEHGNVSARDHSLIDKLMSDLGLIDAESGEGVDQSEDNYASTHLSALEKQFVKDLLDINMQIARSSRDARDDEDTQFADRHEEKMALRREVSKIMKIKDESGLRAAIAEFERFKERNGF